MKDYCFGIDVGGTTIKCGLFTTAGELLEKWEIDTRKEDNGVNILPDIAAAINAKLQEKNIAKDAVAGVGIGIPGPVNEKGEVPRAVNLHWGYVNIVAEMEQMTGLKCKAANDANVAALGELWQGGGVGHHSLLMVTLGTGVGGGVIINDQIVAGAHGAGGEIGHAHIRDDYDVACNCGNHGCLEQFASATGIANLAKRIVEGTDQPTILRGQRLTAKTVFNAVKENDEVAIQIATEFGDTLGKALSIFSCVFDPEVIVIGGGVSKAGPILFDFIIDAFKNNVFSPCRDTEFALATLGNDAGIFGAAKMVI